MSAHKLTNHIEGINSKEQIEQIVDLIDKSKLCEGYHLQPGEHIATMLPHHLEHITAVDDTGVIATVAFSDECSIMLPGTKSKTCKLCSPKRDGYS